MALSFCHSNDFFIFFLLLYITQQQLGSLESCKGRKKQTSMCEKKTHVTYFYDRLPWLEFLGIPGMVAVYNRKQSAGRTWAKVTPTDKKCMLSCILEQSKSLKRVAMHYVQHRCTNTNTIATRSPRNAEYGLFKAFAKAKSWRREKEASALGNAANPRLTMRVRYDRP